MSLRERERIEHPSFGMISISRINSSGKQKFFGSELPVDHWIQIKVSHGAMDRELSKDWFYSNRDEVVTVKLTPIQFSEMITNLNVGDGIPCTIEAIQGKHIEPMAAPESKTDATHRQFKKRMSDFANNIRENQKRALALIEKKTLSKDDQHNLRMNVEWLSNEVERNIPFFMECFQETADRVVAEAKSEVEAAIMHKITTLGLVELHKENKLLADK